MGAAFFLVLHMILERERKVRRGRRGEKEERRERDLIFLPLLTWTPILLNLSPIVMTSFNVNYRPKFPAPNVVPKGINVSIFELKLRWMLFNP